MRILVTGAKGMLGTDLCARLTAEHDVLPYDLPELDITDGAATRTLLRQERPQVVIHCAAYTNVDGCEREPETAFRVNGFGSWNVAAACQKVDAALVYIGTDFVFDGEKGASYDEFDQTNPLGTYGRSKLAGEMIVREMLPRHYIARTAWLFGVHGNNFVKAIMKRARETGAVQVVADQVGCPTHTVDLAEALAQLITTPLYGTYHITNTGSCSWADFAEEILRQAQIDAQVTRISAADWPSPTRRPKDSRLRHLALEMQGRDNLRPWQEALAHYLELSHGASK